MIDSVQAWDDFEIFVEHMLEMYVHECEVYYGKGGNVTIPDKPGALAALLKELGTYRANVVGVQHERAFAATTVGTVQVRLGLDTRGHEHIHELVQGLRRAGYAVDKQ